MKKLYNNIPWEYKILILVGIGFGILFIRNGGRQNQTATILNSQSVYIKATPFFVTAPENQSKTTSIEWSSGGAANAQVYVSNNGAPDQLFAGGSRGIQSAPWIQSPGFYVFKLYEGTAHTNLLAWTSAIAERPPAQKFGLDYWPAGFSSDAFYDQNWTILRPVVASDLDQLSSLGSDVLRVMILPQFSGYILNGSGGGGTFTSKFAEVKKNFLDFLSLCQAKKIRVVVAFGNNYFDAVNGTSGHRWWQDSYSDFSKFIADSLTWINGFAQTIESSPYKSTVIYYDYENEYNKSNPNAGWYTTALYDWSQIPMGKRGESVLSVPTDSSDLKYQLDNGSGPEKGRRHLDFTDFHPYPGVGINSNIENSYDAMQSTFPGSVVLIGEFGYISASQSSEQNQQSTVLDIINRAIKKGVPYYMNWMIYDKTPSPTSDAYGWLYSPNNPKDVLGKVPSAYGLLLNSDMETLQNPCSTFGCSKPVHWTAGGTVPLSFISGGPSYSDAATNQFYARIAIKQASGSAWLSSDLTPAKGGKQIFVNSFIRSNMKNVRMNIVEYDANKNRINDNNGPAFTPGTWSFVNYLNKVGSWSVTLKPNTAFIIVNISGDAVSNPSYLDIDTVSAWQHQ